MAEFKPAFLRTSRAEAGYANDPTDHGGETWAGISRRDHPLWDGWGIVDTAKAFLDCGSGLHLDADKKAALNRRLIADTRLASLVMALDKAKYWDVLGLDDEPRQLIAEKVYDIAFNQGVGAARQELAAARAA